MTCQDFANFLDRFLEGSLPAALAREFGEHLKICADCRNYLDGYRQTGQAARAALGHSADPVPPAVPEKLVAAILAARARTK
jgi:predicted anti-sigma-YlaC factor YlaD